jgi:hypothetical protein
MSEQNKYTVPIKAQFFVVPIPYANMMIIMFACLFNYQKITKHNPKSMKYLFATMFYSFLVYIPLSLIFKYLIEPKIESLELLKRIYLIIYGIASIIISFIFIFIENKFMKKLIAESQE